jgi:CBS domain-containing protein
MKVKDIMSTDVACIGLEDSIQKAAQLMKRYDVGSIPVCRQGEVVGIVTDRDIALRSVADGQDTTNQTVGEVMSQNLVMGEPDMNVHEAAQMMSQNQIRRLPIVNNGHLVGIVALGDISLEPELQDDAEIALHDISEPGGRFE